MSVQVDDAAIERATRAVEACGADQQDGDLFYVLSEARARAALQAAYPVLVAERDAAVEQRDAMKRYADDCAHAMVTSPAMQERDAERGKAQVYSDKWIAAESRIAVLVAENERLTRENERLRATLKERWVQLDHTNSQIKQLEALVKRLRVHLPADVYEIELFNAVATYDAATDEAEDACE